MSTLMLLVTLGGPLLYAKGELFIVLVCGEAPGKNIVYTLSSFFFFWSVYGMYLPGAIYIYPSIS